jgi:GGDEF domain-containing protein
MQPTLEQLPLVRQALERVRELAERAFTSALTGLPNRGAYELVKGAYQDKERPLAVVFMDLTGFKSIHDEPGYEAGNATIVEAGRLWRALGEQVTGACFHFSGDEFVMLLPPEAEATLNDGFRKAIGIARPAPDLARDDLRSRAEAACKRAKADGRDEPLVWSEGLVALDSVRWRCSGCGAHIEVRATPQGSYHCPCCNIERPAHPREAAAP